MREIVAGLIALGLLVFALLLGAALHLHRQRREQRRAAERSQGRRIIGEVPTGSDLLLFSEDDDRFYFADRGISKRQLQSVRLLVNTVPIASHSSKLLPPDPEQARIDIPHPPADEALRDRWDVAIETVAGPILIACGAIRERISQEVATKIYEAVKKTIEQQNLERSIHE